MKTICKYIGIATILIFSFYYTEKMSSIVVNNKSLVKEINKYKDKYTVKAVSAVIDSEYIVPGLNGYQVNVLKSYNNMRYLDAFNDYYLEYDPIIPPISLNNNKDKIIKFGNSSKNSVAIIVKNNHDIINYSIEKNINITRLIDYNTFDKNVTYEQLNFDYLNYKDVELMLNNNNLNHDLCFYKDNIKDLCKEYGKYLVEESIILDKYNLATIKDKIKSGYIIYINDDVNLTDYKLLIRQINYQDLKIKYLSNLLSEERD